MNGKVKSPNNPPTPVSSMFVCRTCIRDTPLPPGELSRGEKVVGELRKLLSKTDLENEIRFRAVSCLNGCVNPCNVAFRGRGQFGFRFGGLVPGDEHALIKFASAYANAEHGNVPEKDWPQNLTGKLTSRVPPM